MRIVIASGNPHKIAEITAIFRKENLSGITLVPLAQAGFTGEIEETGTTFEENALIKARAAAGTGYIAMADDSGLQVDCLDGAPGVYSARYAGEPCDPRKNNEKLLQALRGVPEKERTAKFVSCVALVFPKEKTEFTVRGECPGRILTEYRGNGGFGYDPLFYLEERQKTFAELSPEEKNALSHRARSMQAFVRLLKTKLEEYEYLC